MATWSDVSRLALALPETVELPDGNGVKWEVHRKYFAWERPLRRHELEELGAAAPTGPILGVRVAELDDKRGLIGSNPSVFFMIAHFENYPAVLLQLDRIDVDQLNEVLIESWLCRAPKRLAARFVDELQGP